MRLIELPARVAGVAGHLVARAPQSLVRAVRSFNDQRGAEAAAAMAYYAFLSLFPLLVFLVAAASLLLEREDVYNQLRLLLRDIFPLPSTLLASNLDQILRLSAPIGIVAFVALLWSGIGFFSALSFNLTRAWPDARLRNLLGHRVMGLKMALVLLVLFIVSVVLSVGTSLLPRAQLILPSIEALLDTRQWVILSGFVPWFASFVLFLAFYKWVPNTRVRWRAALAGALVASVTWQVLTEGFSWYLASGLVNYEVVYGSLGGVVAVLIWVYLSNMIAIFCAHLTAAIDQTSAPKRAVGPVESGPGAPAG
ncbi:MAG: YihY/virulence factor BrkB family protein [Anaerolineae bacterium]|jgi:membrane protein|nr:YihY/virulence factor BrkB family protein [Anaerolineae bacterium]